MHGMGHFYWTDGRKFTGEYIEDKKHGYGEYFWPDGSHFRGEWVNGQMHGKGVLINSEGHQ